MGLNQSTPTCTDPDEGSLCNQFTGSEIECTTIDGTNPRTDSSRTPCVYSADSTADADDSDDSTYRCPLHNGESTYAYNFIWTYLYSETPDDCVCEQGYGLSSVGDACIPLCDNEGERYDVANNTCITNGCDPCPPNQHRISNMTTCSTPTEGCINIPSIPQGCRPPNETEYLQYSDSGPFFVSTAGTPSGTCTSITTDATATSTENDSTNCTLSNTTCTANADTHTCNFVPNDTYATDASTILTSNYEFLSQGAEMLIPKTPDVQYNCMDDKKECLDSTGQPDPLCTPYDFDQTTCQAHNDANAASCTFSDPGAPGDKSSWNAYAMCGETSTDAYTLECRAP